MRHCSQKTMNVVFGLDGIALWHKFQICVINFHRSLVVFCLFVYVYISYNSVFTNALTLHIFIVELVPIFSLLFTLVWIWIVSNIYSCQSFYHERSVVSYYLFESPFSGILHSSSGPQFLCCQRIGKKKRGIE